MAPEGTLAGEGPSTPSTIMDLFGYVSYSSTRMPKRSKYLHTITTSKVNNINATLVQDEFDNIRDPEFLENPKTLREGDFARMQQKIKKKETYTFG